MTIIGLHALIYSKKDAATRRFFRDALGFRRWMPATLTLASGEELGIYEPRPPTAIAKPR